jgi:NADH dehydrogenase FAD-containing subunit
MDTVIQAVRDVVVLGGGYAGVMAAVRLAGQSGARARVTLVNAVPHFVERVRLHEVAAGGTPRVHSLLGLTEGSGVQLRIARVVGLDLERRRVLLRAPDGAESAPLSFDWLVYALGSSSDLARVPGVAEHAHAVGSEAEARALRDAVHALRAGACVAVVGGGATAIEAATELAERHPHLRVTLVSRRPAGEWLSEKARAHLADTLARLRIEVRAGAAVEAVEREALRLEGGERLPFDVCVWGGGFVPNPLAREAGLAVTPEGALRVDATLRSVSHPFVLGAGDAVALEGPDTVALRMACATALPLGAHAADNLHALLEGRTPAPFAFSYAVQCISLGRRRGILQRVNPQDVSLPTSVRGWPGAWLKEQVVRYTVRTLKKESRQPGGFSWPGAPRRDGRTQPPPARLEEKAA